MAPLAAPDEVDRLVAFWCQENPELDVETKTLALRIRRVAHLLDRALRSELAGMEVESWEIEMLLALRRSPGLETSAGALQKVAQVTSGAITNRIDRLNAAGLVDRRGSDTDRRQVLVSLTPAGLARADELIAAKNLADQRFFGGIDRATVRRLLGDLRTLMDTLDDGDRIC